MSSRLLGAASIVGIAALLFIPAGGSIAFSESTDSFLTRVLHGRYQPGEVEELARLACFEKAISEIPDGSDATVHLNGDPFIEQRLMEIAFPRVRPVSSDAGYAIFAGVEPGSDAEILRKTACGDVTFWVVAGD